jgi:hypothetical protein
MGKDNGLSGFALRALPPAEGRTDACLPPDFFSQLLKKRRLKTTTRTTELLGLVVWVGEADFSAALLTMRL